MSYWDDLESAAMPAPAATPPAADASGTTSAPPQKSYWDTLAGDDTAQITPENKPAPAWSEVPLKAAYNLPHSAMEFGKNIAQPFIHPIDTLGGIGSIGLGVMEKLGMYGHAGYEKHADAVGKMLMDRYGSVDNIKKTLASDPVGVAADLSAVLTGGGSLAAELPGALGRVGEVAGTVGRAVDPINAVTGAAKGIGKITSEGLGVTTGAGPKAIETAASAGFEGGDAAAALRDNMRGNVPLENVVDDARSALENMRKSRGVDYKQGMAGVAANQTIPTQAWNQIGQAIQDASSIKTFKGQDLSPKTREIRSELNDTVLDWMALPPKDFHTAEGLDALKQKVGDIRDATKFGTPERVIANKYYQAIRQAIVDHVPEYAGVMKGYEKASDQLKEIEKTLSLPADQRKGTLDTSLRKLQSVLRNNVNTNFGQREKMVDYLEANGSPHLKEALAGQSLNSLAPRGLARLATMLGAESLFTKGAGIAAAAPVLATLPLSSPRLMGEASYYAGRAASPLKLARPFLSKPAIRAEFQAGRATTLPEMQARGGAVSRALRTANKGHL